MYLRLGAASVPGGDGPQHGPGGEPTHTRLLAEHREPPELLEPTARRQDTAAQCQLGAQPLMPLPLPEKHRKHAPRSTDPTETYERLYFAMSTFTPYHYVYLTEVIIATF